MSLEKVFNFNGNNLTVFGSIDRPLFVASHVAKLMGYVNAKQAINDNVKEKYIILAGDLPDTPVKLQPQTKLINECGLYCLIFSSKLKIAEEFKDFVFEEVLPSIRKTGQYMNQKLVHKQIEIKNEFQLQAKTVQYLKRFYPDVLFTSSHGELQDTPQKRIKCKMQGYTSGTPDLMIFEPNAFHNILTIEFKSPTGKGVVSDKQILFNTKLKNRGIQTVISDDYDAIITEIINYMMTRRICCKHCVRKFKNEDSLKKHLLYFHRIQ